MSEGNVGNAAVSLRPATLADADLVFGWRNDPFIVARGSSQKTVSRDEHANWFQATVTGSERRMFIVEVDQQPAGQVRFDRVDGESCVVSAYLLERYTGRGLGVEAIRDGCRRIFGKWDVQVVIACVRQDNPAGRAGFLKAGFQENSSPRHCPPQHVELTLTRTAGVPNRKGAVRQ
ncbi:MAG: GNAT family N-acetyltransferase [Acidobacteriia bacterium]|nr:GNAT family N-acetyltransferase [Terriglobia bacterium]